MSNAINLEAALTDLTVARSNFEEKRDYISLSNISKDENTLIRQYRQGFVANTTDRLRCYKGYQMERDLVLRIQAVCIENNWQFGTAPELSMEGGLFKGHPDLWLFDCPADCKSVLRDEWIPTETRHIPYKVKYQLNAYMMASETETSYCIYESRESGLIAVFEYEPDRHIQAIIKTRIANIKRILNHA